jgi:hypothetical protein
MELHEIVALLQNSEQHHGFVREVRGRSGSSFTPQCLTCGWNEPRYVDQHQTVLDTSGVFEPLDLSKLIGLD